MTASNARTTEHTIDVSAPASRVWALIEDVSQWPEVFPPTVHAECVERTGNSELIRIWATANGTAKTWTSHREHDPENMSIEFRQTKTQHPVGGMVGKWIVEPVSDSRCHVRLLHDFFAERDDPADLEWITQAVNRNSEAELGALRTRAELAGPEQLITFEDTVQIEGSATDVYDFLNEAQYWKDRLPHVARVTLEEETAGLQVLEMDTSTKDGSVHTTRSIRVCRAHDSIVYKQIILPPLMALHNGRWTITATGAAGVSATSQHTVRINTSRIADVLGPDADVLTAQDLVRKALSTNSLTTLQAAKVFAESASSNRAAS